MNGVLPHHRTRVTSDGLLQIDDTRLEDAGKYKCVAQNILGREEKVISLIVQSKFSLKSKLHSTVMHSLVQLGTIVRLFNH